jgi:hypothetical protein
MFLHHLHFKGLLILSKCPWSTLLNSDPVHLTSFLPWCVLISALHFTHVDETLCTAVMHFLKSMYGCVTFPWVNIINICLVFSNSAYLLLRLEKVSLFRFPWRADITYHASIDYITWAIHVFVYFQYSVQHI